MKKSIFLILFLISIALSLVNYNNSISQDNNEYVKQNEKKPHWVDFYQEKILITCSDNEVEVEGIYYLRNVTDGNLSMTILYPFPVDKYHPFPHKIEVEEFTFWQDSSNIYFNMSMDPHEKKSIKFHYRQKHYKKSAKYILSSTQQWQHAIQQAEFIISVPKSWNEVNISLQPDKVEIKKDIKIYYITKCNFFPNEDLVITWE